MTLLPLYIDPGTGSMLFSLFIGLATTAIFGARALSLKIKGIVGRGKQTELDKSHLGIVVYSDSKRYWNVFGPIAREFESRKIPLVYYTQSPDDPALGEKFEYVKAEFIGEGKRWFDLVRFAERHAGGEEGSLDPRAWDYTDADGRARSSYSTPSASEKAGTTDGSIGVNHMIDQFLKNEFNGSYATLKNRFKNRYGLYNIIYYMEVKASNGKLEQNPVWNKSTYDQ